ncbi:uncharacterized protein LOC122859786 [Aphidius gifuensis]|uniref:uncharacterized protein LOC122859786 n=1 Tax=Aphidius gifuensis TaxID=684658 RepID=UPI001CDC10D7|nr:uncharacterized protein LOC122859786 [Aphidius gifuensis]
MAESSKNNKYLQNQNLSVVNKRRKISDDIINKNQNSIIGIQSDVYQPCSLASLINNPDDIESSSAAPTNAIYTMNYNKIKMPLPNPAEHRQKEFKINPDGIVALLPAVSTQAKYMRNYRAKKKEKMLKNNCNRLEIIDKRLMNFIGQNACISVYSFDYQSLQPYAKDFPDDIFDTTKILMFFETRQHNNDNINKYDKKSFRCVIKFKRPDVQETGVSIFHDKHELTPKKLINPSTEMAVGDARHIKTGHSNVGDHCLAECITSHNRIIIMVSINIYPDQEIAHIIKFIHKSLLAYCDRGAALYGGNENEYAMVLSGDFKVDFSSPDSEPLVAFLRDEFHLEMNNDPSRTTTKSGTTNDIIFTRYLNNVQPKNYVSYFSYNKPAISSIPIEPSENKSLAITEI